MIKAVEKGDEAFAEFCRRDVFGTRIACLYSCYSTDYDFVKFWKQTDGEGRIIAAISRLDGDVTLCTGGEALDEVDEFLNIVGFRTVQCERSAARRMKREAAINGFVVEYKKNENQIAEIFPDSDFRPKEVYDIIKGAGLIGVGEYLPWLSDITFRMNRGCAEVMTACDGEKAVACAMKLFITEAAVLLGGVATLPEYRSRGLAGSLVTQLAESEKGKRAELLCKNDSIVEFYKSIGFYVKNEWSIINGQ